MHRSQGKRERRLVAGRVKPTSACDSQSSSQASPIDCFALIAKCKKKKELGVGGQKNRLTVCINECDGGKEATKMEKQGDL